MKKHAAIFTIGMVVLLLAVLGVVRSHVPTWKKGAQLQSACEKGDIEAIGLAIDRLGNPNGVSLGETAFHTCVRARQLESLKYLLSRGADVNIQDSRLQTPLHSAVRNSSRSASNGKIIYGPAATREGMAMVEFLLANGADTSSVDDEGRTAKDWAASLGYTAVVQLFDSI